MTPTQSYCEIPLTQGKVALVDAADFDRLNAHKWSAHLSMKKKWYARRSARDKGSKYIVHMHQEVLQINARVDHRDGDGLNNQRSNLRACTQLQNCHNSGKQRNSTYRFKGIDRVSRSSKYRFRIIVNGVQMAGGYHDLQIAAHLDYCVMATKHFGEFANYGGLPVDITTEEVEFMRQRIVELELQNTRLKAPVSDEEMRRHCGFKIEGLYRAAPDDIDELIAVRATRTPPQEGQ